MGYRDGLCRLPLSKILSWVASIVVAGVYYFAALYGATFLTGLPNGLRHQVQHGAPKEGSVAVMGTVFKDR